MCEIKSRLLSLWNLTAVGKVEIRSQAQASRRSVLETLPEFVGIRTWSRSIFEPPPLIRVACVPSQRIERIDQ